MLEQFDILAEAGPSTALQVPIEDVEVMDNLLSISSTSHADLTKFSGIKIRPAKAVSQGLRGHWSFEAANVDGETVLDKSDNGRDGTIVGGVTPDVEAPTEGGGAELNGEDGTILVSDDDQLDPTEYTVSLWLQTDGTGAWSALVGKEGSMWCGFGEDGQNPRFDPYDESDEGEYFASDTNVTDGE